MGKVGERLDKILSFDSKMLDKSLFFLLFVLFTQNHVTTSIMTNFEKFLYDLEQFLPTIQQEIDFAELPGLTDDQAFEQLKSFREVLLPKITSLRKTGLDAYNSRKEHSNDKIKICGQDHQLYFLKLEKVHNQILAAINEDKVTVKTNLEMLKNLLKAFKEWKNRSKSPCQQRV